MKLSIKCQNKRPTDVTINGIDLRNFFTLLLFFFLSTPGIASALLVISTSVGPPKSNKENTGIYDLILHEAFRRIDQQIVIDHLPAERALINSNSGKFFGHDHL